MESVDSFVAVDIKTEVEKAVRKLRADPKNKMIMVTAKYENAASQPVSLLSEAQLFQIAKSGGQTLKDAERKLIPILSLAAQDNRQEQYRAILSILVKTKASGAVVKSGNSFRVITTSAIARRLNINELSLVGVSVPVRTYICRQCVPPRRKRPLGGDAPFCDRISHGTMEEEA